MSSQPQLRTLALRALERLSEAEIILGDLRVTREGLHTLDQVYEKLLIAQHILEEISARS